MQRIKVYFYSPVVQIRDVHSTEHRQTFNCSLKLDSVGKTGITFRKYKCLKERAWRIPCWGIILLPDVEQFCLTKWNRKRSNCNWILHKREEWGFCFKIKKNSFSFNFSANIFCKPLKILCKSTYAAANLYKMFYSSSLLKLVMKCSTECPVPCCQKLPKINSSASLTHDLKDPGFN